MRLAVLGLWLIACDTGAAKPHLRPRDASRGPAKTADADPNTLEGAALYQTLCSHCHGPEAKGYKADNAPSLVNPTFLESATDEFLQRSIALGRPGTSMAGYSHDIGGPLDKEPIARIVAFLRSKGPAAKLLGTAASTGDAARGAALYLNHCKKCHGDATMRVNAVHLANPQFLAAASDAFIRYAILTGRPGTPMESFQGKLGAQDIDDVVAYVRSMASPVTVGELPAPTGKEPLVINPSGKDPVWKNLKADPGSSDKRYVPIDEVKAALDSKRKLVIIDARPPSDWRRVHVTGAVSIPYHDMARLAEIPKDVWVLAYCACPHHLSGVVVDELRKQGHARSLVMDEGILEWHRRGYPVVAAPGVTPPPKVGAP